MLRRVGSQLRSESGVPTETFLRFLSLSFLRADDWVGQRMQFILDLRILDWWDDPSFWEWLYVKLLEISWLQRAIHQTCSKKSLNWDIKTKRYNVSHNDINQFLKKFMLQINWKIFCKLLHVFSKIKVTLLIIQNLTMPSYQVVCSTDALLSLEYLLFSLTVHKLLGHSYVDHRFRTDEPCETELKNWMIHLM